MRIRPDAPLIYGYNSITEMNGKHAEMLMDFGILKMKSDTAYTSDEPLERAYLLINGKVEFKWVDHSIVVERLNCFDISPYCLHVPSGIEVTLTALTNDAEISIQKTTNDYLFDAVFYTPENVRCEMRGQGTMNETSTRMVRTIFDTTNAPHSNLVLGEVIGYPGKWSSYPPHHHPQPEIYYYKYLPSKGYSFSEVGENVYKLYEGDTILLEESMTHPQVVAPGYAVYYIWVIRHLDNNPYITPTFDQEHAWVMDSDAKIWPDK
jgi:5-deoxy-glucuronate isomerase